MSSDVIRCSMYKTSVMFFDKCFSLTYDIVVITMLL